MTMKNKLIIIFLFSLFLISYPAFGLDSFYPKGNVGFGFGYGVGENFEIVDRLEFGIGLAKDFSLNINKYGTDIDIGFLYNLGFPFKQKGIASWYGKENHKKLTASGEPYNMYAYTAAHKTLPFGTIVKVTNLKNGKSVIVRINDRGPFVKGRIIDLSYASAKKIGLIEKGTAPVSIEVLDISGLSLGVGYGIGPYNNSELRIGGVFEFPLVKNISAIFELRFLPLSTKFLYGGGILISINRPLKIKMGIDNNFSSSNFFLEIMLKF